MIRQIVQILKRFLITVELCVFQMREHVFSFIEEVSNEYFAITVYASLKRYEMSKPVGKANVHTLSPGMVFTEMLLNDSTPKLRKCVGHEFHGTSQHTLKLCNAHVYFVRVVAILSRLFRPEYSECKLFSFHSKLTDCMLIQVWRN